MRPEQLTNAELVRAVDNDPNATPREREMATRLDELQTEIRLVAPDLMTMNLFDEPTGEKNGND